MGAGEITRWLMAYVDKGHKEDGFNLRLFGVMAMTQATAVARATLFFLLALAFLPLASAVAQSSASIDGIVHDAVGALVPKARVELKNTATGKLLTTSTNGSG